MHSVGCLAGNWIRANRSSMFIKVRTLLFSLAMLMNGTITGTSPIKINQKGNTHYPTWELAASKMTRSFKRKYRIRQDDEMQLAQVTVPILMKPYHDHNPKKHHNTSKDGDLRA